MERFEREDRLEDALEDALELGSKSLKLPSVGEVGLAGANEDVLVAIFEV